MIEVGLWEASCVFRWAHSCGRFFLFSCLQQLLQVIALNVTVVKFNWSNLFRSSLSLAASISVQLAKLACEFESTFKELSNSRETCRDIILKSANKMFWEVNFEQCLNEKSNLLIFSNSTNSRIASRTTRKDYSIITATLWSTHPSHSASFASWTVGFPFALYFNNSASSLHIFVFYFSTRRVAGFAEPPSFCSL